MEQDQNSGVNKNVALFLTDGLKEAWKVFVEEFQQSYNFNQLDSVLSLLRESVSTTQNLTKKKRLEFMQKGDEESENNNDDNSSSLEKKVFGNHLLANSVFKYLSNSDLFSCRLTNSYWNENATKVLLKSDFKIQFQRKMNRFYLSGSNWKSLDMFTELLKRSKNFPCNKFVFWGGNLGNDDAQRFFNFYGSSIKNIKISFNDNLLYNTDLVDNEKGFSPNLTDSRVIGMILSQQLPNLEHLDLDLRYEGDFEWTGLESLLFPPRKQVKLPNLKQLQYHSGCHRHGDDALLRQLLLAAPNLKSFKLNYVYFDLDGLDNFTATGKVHCIQELTFPPEGKHLEKLEVMVKHEPKLTSLSLNKLSHVYNKSETWERISIGLTKLIESSKNSLKKIQNFNSLVFLPKLQLPVFENVRKLGLEVLKESTSNPQDAYDSSFAFLPKGATFSVNFPRLSSVKICCFIDETLIESDDDAAAWWFKYFPTDEIVPTVKKLNLYRGSCPIFWMKKFIKMFPNLEDLSISDIQDFPSFSKIIWTSCTKLKSLKIGIDISSPLNSHPALDSSFTGISQEVCKKLGTFSPSVLESVAENYMENEPSLLDLTELHTLIINLDMAWVTDYEYSTVLSPLTGICVFKPMERLRQVNIFYLTHRGQKLNESLMKASLEPLTPYKVKIQPIDE